MNSLIKAIERNTAKRKKIKQRIDSEINLASIGFINEDDVKSVLLSANSEDSNRLIDEGAIIEGDGSIYGYIKKGTMEKFLNGENIFLDNLADDFVGYANIGHLDHATFPFPVGEWRKEDMTLVDIGDGRHGINMSNSVIDRESVFIKELERLGLGLSESIEATLHLDLEASNDFGFPVYDEIYIYGFAVCGDGKNVNSNGLQLKGESSMPNDKEKLTANEIVVEIDGTEEVIEKLEEVDNKLGVEEIDITVDEEKDAVEVSEDENANDDAVESDEEVNESDDEVDSDEEDEIEEVEDDDEEILDDEDEVDEADDALEEALKTITSLNEKIAELTNRVEELTKKNRRISKKLKVEKEAKASFLEATKKLSVELLPNEMEEMKANAEEKAAVEEERDYILTGGIANI